MSIGCKDDLKCSIAAKVYFDLVGKLRKRKKTILYSFLSLS